MTDEEKNKMFKRNEPLIFIAINGFGLRSREDEFYDVGLIGITNGINSYDKSKGYAESTYLIRCIRNELTKEIVKQGSRGRKDVNVVSLNKALFDDLYVEDLIADENANIEKNFIEVEKVRERNEMIDLAISKLKPNYQYVVRSYYELGLPKKKLKDLAEELNISKECVSDRLQRARKKLKKILGDYYEKE